LGSYQVYVRTALIPLRSPAERADSLLKEMLSRDAILLEGLGRVATVLGVEHSELDRALKRAGSVIFSARLLDQPHEMVRAGGAGADTGAG